MATDEDARGSSQSFSTKEMLVRLDGKIDAVLARQQGFDVELALVKARADALERTQHDHILADEKAHAEQRTELQLVVRDQDRLNRRLAYQAGAIAALVLIANLIVPVWHVTHH